MKNLLKKLNGFNPITVFRLKIIILSSIGFGLLGPILISLKGTFLLAWIIAVISILSTLAVKLNKYIVKLSLSTIHKTGIFIHIGFVIVSLIYFISPITMLYIEALLAIIESAIFSTFNIKLDQEMANNNPEEVQDYQILRNSLGADAILLGLGITTTLSYFFGIGAAIIAFVIFNSIFSIWIAKNWNFFDKNKN